MLLEPKGYGFVNYDSIADQSLCINDLGLEVRRDESYFFHNLHRNYEGYVFQYTLDGFGYFEHNHTQYKLTKGKAFFITFPHDSSYYFPPEMDATHPWIFFYLHFSGPAILPFYNKITELQGPVFDLPIDSLPIRQFNDLFEVLKSKGQLERYMGSEWLFHFLFSLLKSIEFPPYKPINPHISEAKNWIKSNFNRTINLDVMSQELGITYPHLTRIFCKEEGISPIQYLTHLRLEHSMQLLLNTNLTIEKIAEECGFSCANYFTKVYKKTLHITPNDYRKQHKRMNL